MAALGGIEALLGSLEAGVKKTMTEVMRALVPNLRIGPLDTVKAENFAAYKLTSTTASDTSEFSIEHGIGRTPYLVHQVMDVSAVGARLGIPLTVTRAADANRLYFKTEAGSTSAVFSLYVE